MLSFTLYSLFCAQIASAQSPTPSPTESKQYSCTEDYQCKDAYMICIQNEDCQIDCGARGCQGAIIEAPPNGNLSVNCYSLNSCASVTIYAPKNGNLNVECSGSDKFSDFSCYLAMFDATNMTSGSLNIQSMNSHTAMIGSTTMCPPNTNECKITCITSNSCQSMDVQTGNDSNLKLTASGSNALRSSNIYCNGNSSCTITAFGSSLSILSNLFVYSKYGFSHPMLHIRCNTTDISSCYSHTLPPRMVCGSDYSIISQVYLNPDTNEWRHVYSDNEAEICNDSMPVGWYGTIFDHNTNSDSVFCIDERDCVVKCGWFYCSSSHIYGPKTGDLSLECYSKSSCLHSTVIAPRTGNVDIVCSDD
eukprot:241671_1